MYYIEPLAWCLEISTFVYPYTFYQCPIAQII